MRYWWVNQNQTYRHEVQGGYTRLHRRPPAEADMQQYFQVSPPSVHQMVLTLEQAGFIRRQPGVARNIEILVDPEHLPVLR